jgi:signal transduction histidine kinase
VAVAVLGGVASALRSVTHSLLASAPPPGSPVREMLAESLGDRDLQVAYWLPDRRIFVDERGARVELPAPDTGRAWTSVDRGGRRVAAIIHDADLDAGPELVQAAAAAAALALDNEQLKADLRARLEELRASRVRIVEAGDSARKRIERDLHDGAQQQLVALALDLRMLKAKVHGDGDSAALVERANAKLAAALEELRELARGIHPAILSDRGFAPAVQALTRRVSLPIDCDVRVEGRLPDAVEAAAYFVVAEAITNVVKYSEAGRATVRAWQEGDRIEVEVVDDGIGGADASRGTGLRGLADRLAAVDGTLTLESPPGEGTCVHASIPCGAGELVAEASAVADPPKRAATVLQTSAGDQ